ncbi:MAG: ATP-binding cassette domain-containing protein, partial [Anaerolineae bacterium]
MLLSLRNLRVRFGQGEHAVTAVDDVSLDIRPGETCCLVGESGSGKSVTGLALLRLLPVDLVGTPEGQALFTPGGRGAVAESADASGVDLLRLPETEMQKIRGGRISMIFQEPMTALNPVLTIGEQVMEPLQLHLGMDEAGARRRAVELLTQVHVPDPEQRLSEYPHR